MVRGHKKKLMDFLMDSRFYGKQLQSWGWRERVVMTVERAIGDGREDGCRINRPSLLMIIWGVIKQSYGCRLWQRIADYS